MFQTDTRKINSYGSPADLKITSMSLDEGIQMLIVMQLEDENKLPLIYNRILDATLDKIHSDHVYKDFSTALEHVNSLLESWKNSSGKIEGLNALIGIYAEDTLYFSQIGDACLLMLNSSEELIEVTDRKEKPKDFQFISSGKIVPGEKLLFTTSCLLETLAQDDISEILSAGDVHKMGKDLAHMIEYEHHNNDVGLLIVQKNAGISAQKTKYFDLSEFFFRCCDNNIIKKALSYVFFAQDFLRKKGKLVSQIFFASIFFISLYILYLISSSFLLSSSGVSHLEDQKDILLSAQNNIISAGENFHNTDMFLLEIEEAESALQELESQNLFNADTTKLRNEIIILQKQFNGIVLYTPKPDDLIYNFSENRDVVRIVGVENKVYVVKKGSVIGPIFSKQEANEREFNELENGDVFQDATVQGSDIILITKQGKLVRFSSSRYFSYIDVSGDELWAHSPNIFSYGSNIYLLSDDGKQILRHKRRLGSYGQGSEYLKETDALSIGKIISLGIDGGIYILKHDGSVLKLFRSPQYRIESLSLNKLPENYDFQKIDLENRPSLRARNDLAYVYLLLDNRIYVFKPNSKRYQDTKHLTYIGQIERSGTKIKDFYIEDDGELLALSDDGVYRLSFEIEEERLVIR